MINLSRLEKGLNAMKTIKKTLLLSSLCLMPMLSMAAEQATISDQNMATASTNSGNTYFFIQNADTITLKPGKLILKHIDPKTLWFADAPARDTGYVDMPNYLSLWNTPTAQFRVEQPNAVLQGYLPKKGNEKAQRISAVLVLKAANYDPVTKTLTYQVDKTYLVPDKQDVAQAVNLQQASLLIDVAYGTGEFS
jgi:hypothetical protein